MNSWFIFHNAPLVKNLNVAQWIHLFRQEQLPLCQLQINFAIIEVQIFSVTVHDNIQIFCTSREVYTYFFSTNMSILAKKFLLESVFSLSGNCCISTIVSVCFWAEVFGVVSRSWLSPNFDFSLRRKKFLWSQMLQLIRNRIEKMTKSK